MVARVAGLAISICKPYNLRNTDLTLSPPAQRVAAYRVWRLACEGPSGTRFAFRRRLSDFGAALAISLPWS